MLPRGDFGTARTRRPRVGVVARQDRLCDGSWVSIIRCRCDSFVHVRKGRWHRFRQRRAFGRRLSLGHDLGNILRGGYKSRLDGEVIAEFIIHSYGSGDAVENLLHDLLDIFGVQADIVCAIRLNSNHQRLHTLLLLHPKHARKQLGQRPSVPRTIQSHLDICQRHPRQYYRTRDRSCRRGSNSTSQNSRRFFQRGSRRGDYIVLDCHCGGGGEEVAGRARGREEGDDAIASGWRWEEGFGKRSGGVHEGGCRGCRGNDQG
mmetsp:Transcript_35155/g.74179  ORF Transcript_35155/g.74179 Transcript_35155/m.74179 type:complete len:261 (+) Transcript_35155:814-1596(+)